METETNKEYASKGVAGTGLGLGIAGTALGLLAGGGMLGGATGGLFGNVNSAQNEIGQLRNEVTRLASERYTDAQIRAVTEQANAAAKDSILAYAGLDKRVTAIETAAPLREQILRGEIAQVAQASTGASQALAARIAELNQTVGAITKLGVPNSALIPGVPPVFLTHMPPPPPPAPTAPEATSASTGS